MVSTRGTSGLTNQVCDTCKCAIATKVEWMQEFNSLDVHL